MPQIDTLIEAKYKLVDETLKIEFVGSDWTGYIQQLTVSIPKSELIKFLGLEEIIKAYELAQSTAEKL